MQLNNEILSMALVGLEHQQKEISRKMIELAAQLGGHNGRPPKRTMSTAARKSIARAQRKRWAEWRRRKAA